MNDATNAQPERREYCLTPEEFNEFVGACNPRILLGDARLLREHSQRCAQAFWEKMGRKYGFDWTTTAPVQGKHQGFFAAVPLAPSSDDDYTVERCRLRFPRALPLMPPDCGRNE